MDFILQNVTMPWWQFIGISFVMVCTGANFGIYIQANRKS